MHFRFTSARFRCKFRCFRRKSRQNIGYRRNRIITRSSVLVNRARINTSLHVSRTRHRPNIIHIPNPQHPAQRNTLWQHNHLLITRKWWRKSKRAARNIAPLNLAKYTNMIWVKRVMFILIVQPYIINPYTQSWRTAKHRHMIEITQHVRKIGVIKRTGSNLLIKTIAANRPQKTTAGIVNGRVPTNRNTAITPSHRPNFRQRRIDIITPVIRLLFHYSYFQIYFD